MSELIYLDCAATTPLLPEAAQRLAEVTQTVFGNPSSAHELGAAAEAVLTASRKTIARHLGARPSEIAFTSGGSEADSMALFGAVYSGGGGGIVVSAIEHPAVLESARELEQRGFPLTIVPVDALGRVKLNELANAVTESTRIVSIGYANSEIGTIQDLNEVVSVVKRRNPQTLVHTDAVQAFAHVSFNCRRLGVDLLSVAAHKLHGPKGTGALFIRDGVRIRPLVYGGDQEGGRRAGTENVPAIAGFATACDMQFEHLESLQETTRARIELIRLRLADAIPGVVFNGAPDSHLPGVLSVSVPGVKAQNLMTFLESQGTIVSAGSACHSQTTRQSHVLEAIGVAGNMATIRISVSHTTTQQEAETAADALVSTVKRLRKGKWKK